MRPQAFAWLTRTITRGVPSCPLSESSYRRTANHCSTHIILGDAPRYPTSTPTTPSDYVWPATIFRGPAVPDCCTPHIIPQTLKLRMQELLQHVYPLELWLYLIRGKGRRGISCTCACLPHLPCRRRGFSARPVVQLLHQELSLIHI